MFRTKEKAEALRSFRVDHPTQDLIIDDDFGQHGEIKAGSIHGVIIEDMDLSKVAAVEFMLHNTRIHSQATTRAQSDPALKADRRAGPQVLTPFPGNGLVPS
jgi:hypothetical protein